MDEAYRHHCSSSLGNTFVAAHAMIDEQRTFKRLAMAGLTLPVLVTHIYTYHDQQSQGESEP